MDRGHVALLGLLDLSAAFDTVDYSILLERLEKSFSIVGTPLAWIASYLENRVQTVVLNQSRSRTQHMSCGVPQGSVLGPLLFILYTKDVTAIIQRHGLLNHCYADDTQIYFYCKPEDAGALAQTFAACTDELCAWMRSNRLKLNCDKTECLWIMSKQRSKVFSEPSLSVGGFAVESTTGARNLGVYFDNQLNLKQHISNVCRACYFQLRQLCVVRRSLPSDVLRTLLHAIVSCRLDYCNALLVGLPACDIRRLQTVQNAAARLFGGASRRDHVTPILRDDLHWLPVQQRIHFKIGVLTYKALHGLAPPYLTGLCIPVSSNPALLRNRSADRGDLIVPRTRTITLGRCAFAVAAPSFWNTLPVDLHRSPSLSTFRSGLKTLLFREAYNISP